MASSIIDEFSLDIEESEEKLKSINVQQIFKEKPSKLCQPT